LGHDDTLWLIRQLAVTGDRHAIPILKDALRHHKSNVRADAALALHALGDAGGLEALISNFHSADDSDKWKFANALECVRNPRAAAAVAEYNAAKRASEELKQRRINEGLCLTCGKALGFMDKMSSRQIHKHCS
jgi:HEAT repeat protein